MTSATLAALVSSAVFAVPGPDSVAVVANTNVPSSAALAETYRLARSIPRARVCALDLPTEDTISLDELNADLLEPLFDCLGDAAPQIEAVLLVRGVPLRVSIPAPSGDQRVSTAAAVGLWRTRTASTGVPLLGRPPGVNAMCGQVPCLAARYANPFTSGAFEAGWSLERAGVLWEPVLVTMLHGRTFEEAEKLITSALDAEANGGAEGTFTFMNGADGARDALDFTYPLVINELTNRGFTAERVEFDSNLTGKTFAAFFVGTASLGSTIEGNSFHPGALVDNLTSFGAVPPNFEEGAETQVSIARWVAMGVAGVHGTTDEPLSNVFPSRHLIVDYVEGNTLAESFHRNLPYSYWRNLVLGDPIAAPYAVRPEVFVEGVLAGEAVDGSRELTVTARDPAGRGIEHLALFVDGLEVASSTGAPIVVCAAVPVGAPVQILAVAEARDESIRHGPHGPKGWRSLDIVGLDGFDDCRVVSQDAGFADSGARIDAGVAEDAGEQLDAASIGRADADQSDEKPTEDGCDCAATPGSRERPSWWSLLLLNLLAVRRRRVFVKGDARARSLQEQ